jgi:hypothetical protein
VNPLSEEGDVLLFIEDGDNHGNIAAFSAQGGSFFTGILPERTVL